MHREPAYYNSGRLERGWKYESDVPRPSIGPPTASGGSSASLTQRGFRLKAGEYLGKVTN